MGWLPAGFIDRSGAPVGHGYSPHGSYTPFDMPVSGFDPLLDDDREAVHGSPLELYIDYRFYPCPSTSFFDIPFEDLQFAMISGFRH